MNFVYFFLIHGNLFCKTIHYPILCTFFTAGLESRIKLAIDQLKSLLELFSDKKGQKISRQQGKIDRARSEASVVPLSQKVNTQNNFFDILDSQDPTTSLGIKKRNKKRTLKRKRTILL